MDAVWHLRYYRTLYRAAGYVGKEKKDVTRACEGQTCGKTGRNFHWHRENVALVEAPGFSPAKPKHHTHGALALEFA